MSHWAAKLFAKAIESLINRKEGQSSIGNVIDSIWKQPIKLLAAFFVAPFLVFRVAAYAKNPARRYIAGFGLFVSVLGAWFAGTFIGTAVGALLIAAKVGLLWGIAFIVGTGLSVILSVTFSIIVLNSLSCLFLHMSSEEVIDHLKSISE